MIDLLSWFKFGLIISFLYLSISGSSSIKVKDEATGNTYAVGAHNISAAFNLSGVNVISFLLLIVALLNLIE